MADTTLNKRIAALAKKLGVSPLDLKNDLVGQMSVVKKEFGDGYEPTSNIDLANEIGKSLQARGPEYYKLFRDHYDAENPNKPFSRVVEPFNTILSEMADRGLEGDAKERYANPFGYEEDPNGEGFSVPSDSEDAFIEEFEEETGDAATPDRPKPTPQKTLDQPEGGAAQAPGGMPMTPEGQAQANLQAKINSMPEDVDLGTGGATKKSRSRMNLQAEADRQAADIIKQQKKASDQNNFLRDRYDATNGRRAGAFDRLSDQQKDEAVSNYRNRSYSDDSNPFVQQQYNDLMASGYTPPKADIQSQYEAASMNPPSVARADGTATTEEFGSMSPAQQRAFIQNYKYNPQGQSPETVEEGTMMGAQASSNPEVNLETLTVPDPEQDIVNELSKSANPNKQASIDLDSIINPPNQGGSLSNSYATGTSAAQPRPTPDPEQDIVNELSKSANSPSIQNLNDILNPGPESGRDSRYQLPTYEQEQPVSPLDNPDTPRRRHRQAPIDIPEGAVHTKPEGTEFNNKPEDRLFNMRMDQKPYKPIVPKEQPPAPAPAPESFGVDTKGKSPIYGKKPDGSMGIVGYRNTADMKTGAYTPTMRNNERLADQNRRARSGEMENPFASAGGTYNRALGQQNEDAFAKRRAQQAELAKKAARQRELAAMPTPRANAAMDVMNGLPQADQVGIVNQYRKRRGEKPIFNPYSA